MGKQSEKLWPLIETQNNDLHGGGPGPGSATFAVVLSTLVATSIFPINMKGLAGSLVTLVSWLGSWIVSYSFNFLLNWSSTGIFFIFSSICGFSVLIVGKFVPETKGRTLEEFQAAMNPLSIKSYIFVGSHK